MDGRDPSASGSAVRYLSVGDGSWRLAQNEGEAARQSTCGTINPGRAGRKETGKEERLTNFHYERGAAKTEGEEVCSIKEEKATLIESSYPPLECKSL